MLIALCGCFWLTDQFIDLLILEVGIENCDNISEIFHPRAEIQVTLVNGKCYISRVDPNSAAEAM
jgi:hypothetical protein